MKCVFIYFFNPFLFLQTFYLFKQYVVNIHYYAPTGSIKAEVVSVYPFPHHSTGEKLKSFIQQSLICTSSRSTSKAIYLDNAI
jgi:hypothetical protein